jgi:signal transduction histidine kinase
MHPDKLVRLTAISRRLSSYEELDDLVQVIVQTAAELTEAEGSSLLLFDERDEVLRYVAVSWCGPGSAQRVAVEEAAVPLKNGVAGWVMRKMKPVNVHRTGEDPLIDPAIEAQMPAPVRCIAATPLIYRNVPIGVLESFNHPAGRFPAEAIEALETLSSLASVAIYNGHLLHRMQRAYDALADLDQMKTDFIAIASHELRTPLGVIIGHTSVLQEISDRDVREHLAVIERNALQLQDVIENFTAINRLEAPEVLGHTAPIPLNAFLEESVRGYQEEARSHRITLKLELPPRLLHARIEPEKLSIITNNLIRNALAFTADSGAGKVLVSLKEKSGQAVVAVIDNGIGIPEKDLERIFDLFYQVERHMQRKHGGMGVGLTTAKFLVEQAGGKMRVDSIEGSGSCFSFSLPVSIAGSAGAALSSE